MLKNTEQKPGFIQIIIISVVSILAALLLSEILLRAFDPIGVLALREEARTRYENMNVHPAGEGYTIRAGRYQVADYHMTITGDGSRLVIQSDPSAECSIAMIGDSFTFGSGVDDSAVWSNLFAADNDHRIINAGHGGTNAVEILSSMERYPADGYVWFLFNNDNLATVNRDTDLESPPPAVIQHIRFQFIYRNRIREYDDPAFVSAASEIHQRGAMIFSYDDNPLLELLPESIASEIITIPAHTSDVSVADGHPDATGHQQIYNAIAPDLKSYADSVCE